MPNWWPIQNKFINTDLISKVEITNEGHGPNDSAAQIFVAGGTPVPVKVRDWPTVRKALRIPE